MSNTTAETLTETQIRNLRAESVAAGDMFQAAICDLALTGEIDPDEVAANPEEIRRAGAMGREGARAAVVDAINAAEAQS